MYMCVCVFQDCKTQCTQCKYTVVLSRTCGFSETDDSSSIPPPEPGPLSRKPSGLHLTLPDFQETETGLCYCVVCGCWWVEQYLLTYMFMSLLYMKLSSMCLCVYVCVQLLCIRLSECSVPGRVSAGAGLVGSVCSQLHAETWPCTHLDHSGAHLAAGR